MQDYLNFNFDRWLVSAMRDLGVPEWLIEPTAIFTDIIAVIIIILILDIISRRVILASVDAFIKKTKAKWDDVFLENRVFTNTAHLIPVLLLDYFTPIFFKSYPVFLDTLDIITDLAFTWLMVKVLISTTTALTQLSKGDDKYVSIAVQSMSQLVKVVIFVLAVIVTFSIILKIDLKAIFGTLGALTAIIILIFRDTILGFVASIQLSTSKMLKVGDWVTLPSYNADGPLIELNLVTAKIQNWDKTITTVPTYALISSSVKNWEGMSEAGVRRIKRSVNIDVNSIRFISEEDINRFRKFDLLKEFVEKKEKELQEFNKKNVSNPQYFINGRRQTNIGVFRKYAELYLQNHPMISKQQTLMVRQLQPSEKGVPLEIYCFSIDTAWVRYEGIQSDIFDHLYASAKEFGLRLFQSPSGNDVLSLKDINREH